MSAILLEVDKVGKAYPPTLAGMDRMRALWQVLRHGRSEGGSRVLEDISFSVPRGESLAIIGSNGAGKSTLLKMVTGVLAPSEGRVTVNGRISALLELGAGFEPDYTGLDNLRMNAAFMGLSREHINAKMDEILAFADIGESIHEPVKHYSSGMVVRLGFAIVASVRPDLLITDEVLAVGDESFQKKCIRWVEQFIADGGTLLMVSHNMYQAQKLCRRALWLHDGRARAFGDVFDVTQAYLAWHEAKDSAEKEITQRPSHGICRVESVQLGQANTGDESATGEPQKSTGKSLEDGISGEPDGTPLSIDFGQTLEIRLVLSAPDERAPAVLVGLARVDGTPVYGVATDHDGVVPSLMPDGRFEICLAFDSLALLPGSYRVKAHAMDPEGLRVHDTLESEFTVRGKSRALGLVHLPHRWSRTADDSADEKENGIEPVTLRT
ncbi:MAG: ABC transporter ATP-binding protein [Wenzhouxiangellaceae bacterium]|nr:ABC transporter ATP-binding protein [Wenzhouxiangellaceae bacterium]